MNFGQRLSALRNRVRRVTPRTLPRLLARLWFSGVFYHRTLRGRRPRQLEFLPNEMWPGDADRGRAIINGEFCFVGQTLKRREALWRPSDVSREWVEELHSFNWLADLNATGGEAARETARDLVAKWLETEGVWRPASWRGEIAATRLINWLTYAEFLFLEAEDQLARDWMDSLARHGRHLRRLMFILDPGIERLVVLRALIYASLCLASRLGRFEKWSAAIAQEIHGQINADGGHVSRSPQAQFRVFRDLVDLRAVLRDARAEVPDALQNAIDRMAPMVRFFRHGDGGLCLFNDSNENENWLLDVALTRAEARGKPMDAAPHSGFQRLTANRTLILVDAGLPAAAGFDEHAHAGALSLELSIGRERLIVNCGAYAGTREDWKLAQRTTAAHSTVSIADLSSSEILPGSMIGVRPGKVSVRRNESAGNIWIDATLEDYAGLQGLNHRRRIYLSASGGDIRGEDTLSGDRANHKFTARFHLHPSVKASSVQDGESILLRLGDGGGWRFRATGGVTNLQESVYLGERGRTKRSDQIVVAGATQGGSAQIKWALTRLTGE
jgi:uncharacterized heparinase superfamily protein